MATFRLTVDIDAEVKRESHTIAIAQGKQLREVVEQAMREYNAKYKTVTVYSNTTKPIKGLLAPLELKTK